MQSLLSQYHICDMNAWSNVDANLIITDPPFGININSKQSSYNRNIRNVVNGYVEWPTEEYSTKIKCLLNCIAQNLTSNGQALIFSGWNNSNIIQNEIINNTNLILQGKMYWCYNFAKACQKRPAHNVCEIFWVTQSKTWFYSSRCLTHHCLEMESNLSTLWFKKDYHKNMPKYPTRHPFKLLKCLTQHFSNEDNLIFDPLAGSGMVGIVAESQNRQFLLGDLNPNGKLVFEHLFEYYNE